VLERRTGGKVGFGTQLPVLGKMAGNRSGLVWTAHPYLEKVNKETRLSAFLGLRSDRWIVLIDKADSACGIKVSSEIGMQMPMLAGAGIKAVLSLLSDEEIDEILARTDLKKYTPYSIVDKAAYKEEILRAREQGVAYDREEYIEGMVAFAVPLNGNNRDLQAAFWVVGLAHQVDEDAIPKLTGLLKRISEEISQRVH